MSSGMDRRDFLKWFMTGAAGAILVPKQPPPLSLDSGQIVRVATTSVSVYKEPSDKSQILYQRRRDDLVNTYFQVNSEDGPSYNPRWYRVWGGYMYSAHLQKVSFKLNPVASFIPETGQLAEVTVPFTQSMLERKPSWEKAYPLYYQSVHWIHGLGSGPDGKTWYRLHDELTEEEYFADAEHLRLISPIELAPLAPDVPDGKKRIEVNLATQTLQAFEGNAVVLKTKISSGVPTEHVPGKLSTRTPIGEYHIETKMPSKHMGRGEMSSDPEAYILPGVPWTSFFIPDEGVAFHGTYWHDNYGTPMSHGCINMKPEEAKWIFRWSKPVNLGDKVEVNGYGTLVIVN